MVPENNSVRRVLWWVAWSVVSVPWPPVVASVVDYARVGPPEKFDVSRTPLLFPLVTLVISLRLHPPSRPCLRVCEPVLEMRLIAL